MAEDNLNDPAKKFTPFEELVLARFDQIDARHAAFETAVLARFDAGDQRFDAIDKRFDAMDERFDGIDKRLDAMDKRFDGIDERLDAMDKRFDQADTRVDMLVGSMRAETKKEIAASEGRIISAIEVAMQRVGYKIDALSHDVLDVRVDLRIFSERIAALEEK